METKESGSMEDDNETAEPRTVAEILEGVAPGVEFIRLGGVAFPAREPDFIRASKIMVLQGEYEDLRQDKRLNSAERMGRINEIMAEIVKSFSADIERDWERIETEATMEEILQALQDIALIVGLPFVKRALAVVPEANRKTRRARNKK